MKRPKPTRSDRIYAAVCDPLTAFKEDLRRGGQSNELIEKVITVTHQAAQAAVDAAKPVKAEGTDVDG
jgi:hypothetical protein